MGDTAHLSVSGDLDFRWFQNSVDAASGRRYTLTPQTDAVSGSTSSEQTATAAPPPILWIFTQ